MKGMFKPIENVLKKAIEHFKNPIAVIKLVLFIGIAISLVIATPNLSKNIYNLIIAWTVNVTLFLLADTLVIKTEKEKKSK